MVGQVRTSRVGIEFDGTLPGRRKLPSNSQASGELGGRTAGSGPDRPKQRR
ncbi:hypothetical protein [Pseudarthrobacter sp. LT1]|uniref:hypothetical protein n=1 Tax=Pseudarthrobacter sp. LT1 TaxID=3111450 RepID=UPI002D76AA82|nr:hypothetical protein [Pseudarthrobacter sp. LT1]WRT14542.1 hypothetical protein VIK36_03355 [Pseudarthrobacter sp. LT1]